MLKSYFYNVPQIMHKVLNYFTKDWKALVVVFLFAYIIRIFYLPFGGLSFAYDQARDAFVASNMARGDFKILGPPVSGVPGLYHGVFYYYLITPFYVLGNGSPLLVAYVQSFINALGIFIAYTLGRTFTKSRRAGILSAVFYAISYEATQYANLLTNVSLAALFVPLFYLFLYLWLVAGKFYSVFSGLFFGLMVQSEIALLYHAVPLIIFVILRRGFIHIVSAFQFIVIFVLTTLSMILVEIKFGFKGVGGLIYLLTRSDGISKQRDWLDIFTIYIGQLSETVANNIFPASFVIAGVVFAIILIATVYKLKTTKKKNTHLAWQYFLPIAIAPQIVALPFGGGNMRHLMVGAGMLITTYFAIFTSKHLIRRTWIFATFVFLVLFTNTLYIFANNVKGQTIFPLQRDLTISKVTQVVDYTYTAADKGAFSVNTITSPLWINTLWSYSYNWYGFNKYNYLPRWAGHNQVGQLGNNLAVGREAVHFLIIEPTYGIPEGFINQTLSEENSVSVVLEEKHFGDIIVQKRAQINW